MRTPLNSDYFNGSMNPFADLPQHKQPWDHLTVSSDGLILVDAHTLANDVLGAYSRSVRPLAEKTDGSDNVHTMQERLNEMLTDDRIAPAEALLRELLPPQPMQFSRSVRAPLRTHRSRNCLGAFAARRTG